MDRSWLHRCQSAYDPHRRVIAELSHRLYGNQPDPARIHRRLSERRTPMRDLCNTDKPLFAVLTKLTYSAYLNILWLVCSLPIVTIGASTTALFYVTLKMAEDRDDGLTRMFFKAFRENFKPATKLWLILLAVAVSSLRMALCCAECGAKHFLDAAHCSTYWCGNSVRHRSAVCLSSAGTV